MDIKSNISKILFVSLWTGLGAAVLVLLVAAINKKNGKICSGYEILINSDNGPLFIGNKEIGILLTQNGTDRILGKTMVSFDLHKMEERAKREVWVKEAQLFFDNNGVLKVRIRQREPIARIFTVGGNSFYMDSSGVQMPLSDKSSARIPVFTSFPSERLRTNGPDSVLIRQIRKLSHFIFRDPFWMSQIEQIDISPTRKFEMIPVLGIHVIEFGDGNDYVQKFHRLFIFYQEVMAKTGFNKYCKVDVQYTGQVIGTVKGSNGSQLDAAKAIRSVEQLIKSEQKLHVDTIHQQNIQPLEHNTLTEQTLTNYDLPGDDEDSVMRHQPVHLNPGKSGGNKSKILKPVKNIK